MLLVFEIYTLRNVTSLNKMNSVTCRTEDYEERGSCVKGLDKIYSFYSAPVSKYWRHLVSPFVCFLLCVFLLKSRNLCWSKKIQT